MHGLYYIALQSHTIQLRFGVSQQHSGRRKAYNAIITIATNEYDTSFRIELLQNLRCSLHQNYYDYKYFASFLSLHEASWASSPLKNELGVWWKRPWKMRISSPTIRFMLKTIDYCYFCFCFPANFALFSIASNAVAFRTIFISIKICSSIVSTFYTLNSNWKTFTICNY